MQKGTITNNQPEDNSSKLIFGDAVLCSQFMRDYLDIPILKKVRPEDIEDVSERYVPLFTAERESDVVKKVRISDSESLFFISLIEHKTEVDYNVIMQLFRYMCYIWEDYEKEAAKQSDKASTRKGFKYPPILPIVYYEGKGEWTAVTHLKDRVFLSDVFEKYIPDFTYELIKLQDYSGEELLQNQDEISLIMLLNKLQDAADFKMLPDISKAGMQVWHNTPEYLLDIIAKVTTVLLTRLNVPQTEVDDFVGRIKERNMPELFEHFKGYDVQAARKEAREEGQMELLVTQVCRKLKRQKSAAEIAEALEEEEALIGRICTVAERYAPDYEDINDICKELLKEN